MRQSLVIVLAIEFVVPFVIPRLGSLTGSQHSGRLPRCARQDQTLQLTPSLNSAEGYRGSRCSLGSSQGWSSRQRSHPERGQVERRRKMRDARVALLEDRLDAGGVQEDSERIFRPLKAGADGYLVKSSPPEVLLEAIDDVHRGGSPISSHIARKVVRHFHLVGPSPTAADNLSQREKEVLNLLSSGYLYKEISDQLGIGLETVRTYVKNICAKMHVRNRVEAVAKQGSNSA